MSEPVKYGVRQVILIEEVLTDYTSPSHSDGMPVIQVRVAGTPFPYGTYLVGTPRNEITTGLFVVETAYASGLNSSSPAGRVFRLVKE